MTEPIKRRRWFRFRLRMLLVVVTVLCVWLGFTVNAARRQKQAVAAILRAGGTVNYDYELKPYPNAQALFGKFRISYSSMFYAEPQTTPPGPAWMRTQFGDDYFRTAVQVYLHLNDPIATRAAINELANLHAVKCVQLFASPLNCKIDDSDLNPLGQLDRLERLWLQQTRATGAFLARIRDPASITQLSLETNDIDDAAMVHIGKMSNVENLVLSENPRITDTGLANLHKLTKLKVLLLNGTGVSDAGLEQLMGLDQLIFLSLWNSHASSNGIRELRLVLPNCQITGP